MNNKLTYERLHKLIYYDPLLGHFYWTSKAKNKKKGKRAESRSGINYRYITIDKINYPAHRLAWFYMEGYFPECDIDHINRYKYDNRWKNLRHVSRSCNVRNSKINIRNSSGVTGVTKSGNGWCASIGWRNKRIPLGYYKDFTFAVIARLEAEVKLNYHDCQTTSTAVKYLLDLKRECKIL
jgi:hypothetical protein